MSRETTLDSEDKVATKDVKQVFGLPHRVSRRLRDSARAHGAEDHRVIRYLWLKLDDHCSSVTPDGEMKCMDTDQWLNVVDEAASVGVECMVLCVGGALSDCPALWAVSRWAQDVHGMTVGLHMSGMDLSEEEASALLELDPALTWLFVELDALADLSRLHEYGVHVCCAHVERKDTTAACDGPNSMACVGPNGLLFSCGSVLGFEQFQLGHVADKPLGKLLGDECPDRTIADGTARNEHGCNGCPNQMVARIAGLSA